MQSTPPTVNLKEESLMLSIIDRLICFAPILIEEKLAFSISNHEIVVYT